jgi:hypothetical protein
VNSLQFVSIDVFQYARPAGLRFYSDARLIFIFGKMAPGGNKIEHHTVTSVGA